MTIFNSSELVEQKSTDKVEPKFKVDDWVVTDKNDVVQIKAVNNGYYTIDNGMDFNMPYVDRCWRRWDITKDAKPGDVLANDHHILILKELDYNWGDDGTPSAVKAYCGIKPNGNFEIGKDNWCFCGTLHIHPATKEQRDTLLKAMAEAEYEWDDDKKELKKIEQKTDDKVEPKFKVGDWVIDKQDFVHQISNVVENVTCHTYGYDTVGEEYFNDNTEGVRLWNIQDAKEGDVLVNGSNIFIFHFINDTRLMGYCHVNTDDGRFYDDMGKNECFCLIDAVVNPATKEQRYLLFSKMHESGYEWYAEKNELRKIAQNLAWGKEDEQNLNAALSYIDDEYLRRWLKDAIYKKYEKYGLNQSKED